MKTKFKKIIALVIIVIGIDLIIIKENIRKSKKIVHPINIVEKPQEFIVARMQKMIL